jgi:outer membrane cobalamin receptor
MDRSTTRRAERSRARAVPALVMAALLPGCATAAAPAQHFADNADLEPGGMVLTAEDIRRTGARDAMEAIERAGSHLVIARTRQGTPASIYHRGVDSFVISREVLLVVDGTRVKYPVDALRGIPAKSIRYIQILSGREAVTRWGSESTNGVIMVRTSAHQ